MGRSSVLEDTLSERKRQYRKFTPQQKLELVMASWRGEKSIAELCREHDISESLLRRWREQVLDAGIERFAAGEQRIEATELRRRLRSSSGRSGARPTSSKSRGNSCECHERRLTVLAASALICSSASGGGSWSSWGSIGRRGARRGAPSTPRAGGWMRARCRPMRAACRGWSPAAA